MKFSLKQKLCCLILISAIFYLSQCKLIEKGIFFQENKIKDDDPVTFPITVESVEINSGRCQNLPLTNFTFYLNYMSVYDEGIESFEIEFISDSLIKVENVHCFNDLSDPIPKRLKCITNSTISKSGKYHPLLKEPVIGKDQTYKIEPFNLEDDTISFTKQKFNPVNKNGKKDYIYIRLDFKSSQTNTFSLSFNDPFEDSEQYPTIKLNNEILKCGNELENLTCIINNDNYNPNKDNEGEIINICGVKEIGIKVITDTKTIVVPHFKDYEKFMCSVWPINYKIDLEYESLKLSSDKEYEYKIIDKIKIQNIKSEIIENMNCLLDKSQFYCSLKEVIDMKGSYYMYLNEDLNFENVRITQFKSTVIAKDNEKYNKIINPSDSTYTIYHGYDESEEGKINITYEKNLTEIPKVTVNGKESSDLVITISEENKHKIIIAFNEKVFPYEELKPKDFKQHLLVIYDVCDTPAITIKVNVNSAPSTITINKLDVSGDKCFSLQKGFKFLADAQGMEDVTIPIDFEEVVIQKKEDTTKNYKMVCTLNKEELYCAVKETPSDPGDYIITLREDFKRSGITIISFKTDVLHYHPDDIDIKEVANEFELDYGERNKWNLRIQYFGKLSSNPKVVNRNNSKEIECEFSTAAESLYCNINEDTFPYNKEKPETVQLYLIDIYNLCGGVEKTIQGKIFYTPKELKTIKATTDKVCSTLSQGTEIKITIDKYLDEEYIINDKIFLQNINDIKYTISTKCTLNNNNFICTTTNKPTKEGKYNLVLSDDYRLKPIIILSSFNLTSDIYYNDKPLDLVNKFNPDISTNYNYTEYGSIGKLVIPFKQNLRSLGIKPKIRGKEGVYLDCRLTSDYNLTCDINQKYLPADITHTRQYKIEMENTCGNLDEVTFLVVSGTPKFPNISFIGETYNNKYKCLNFDNNFLVSIKYTEKNNLTNYNILKEDVIIEKEEFDENKYILKCQESKQKKTLECKQKEIKTVKDGNYYLYIPSFSNKLYFNDYYKANETFMLTNKKYSEPNDDIFNFIVNYGKTNKFNIGFKSELKSEDLPIIKSKSTQKNLNCKKSETNNSDLSCELNKDEYPLNSTNHSSIMVYEFYIVDVCGFKESNINISVYSIIDEEGEKKVQEKNNVVVIVFIVVGVVTFLTSIIVFIMYKRRHKKSSIEINDDDVEKLSGMINY